MSFIYRDYAGPMVAAGNHVIKMKKLFQKLAPTEYVDGVHVYSNRQVMLWDTRYPPATPRNGKFTFNQPEPFGRLTKRFLAGLGMKTKDFKKGQFGDLSRAWYKIDQKKYAVATYDLGKPEIVTKLNTFFDEYNPAPAVYPIFHLPQKSTQFYSVGNMSQSGKPWYKIMFYEAVTGVYSGTTYDGVYYIEQDGNIALSGYGHVSNVSKYVRNHDSINSNNNRQYKVALFTKDPITGLDVITVENIEIRTVMDEIKVTVKYAPATGMLVQGNPQDFTGLINTLNTDKLTYLGGIRADYQVPQYMKATEAYNSNDLIDPTNKYESIVSTDYDNFYGHPLEVLAIMDDGDAFDIVGYGDYKIDYTDMMAKNGDIDPRNQQFLVKTFEYSVTLKRRETILQTDTLVDRVYNIHQAMQKSAKKLDRLSNDTVDTMIKNAVLELIDDEAMDVNNYFYRGYLRVDAVTVMTNKDFFFLMNRALTLKYEVVDKNENFLEKVTSVVIAIVVIVIAVIIAVFVTIATGNWTAGLAAAQLWMGIANMYLAKNHPEYSTAIKLIGIAMEINSWLIALSDPTGIMLMIKVAKESGYLELSDKEKYGALVAAELLLSGGANLGQVLLGAAIDYVVIEGYLAIEKELDKLMPGITQMILMVAVGGGDISDMVYKVVGAYLVYRAADAMDIEDMYLNMFVMFVMSTIVANTTYKGIMNQWEAGRGNLWNKISNLTLSDISGIAKNGASFMSTVNNALAASNRDTLSNQAAVDQGKPEAEAVSKEYTLYSDNTTYDAINITYQNFVLGTQGLKLTYDAIRVPNPSSA